MTGEGRTLDGAGAAYFAASPDGGRTIGSCAVRDDVEAAQRGDRDAYGRLVDREVNRLFAIAYRIVGDWDVADDAVQEAMVAGWRDIGGLRDADRFEAWLYRILVRQCYRSARHLRARRRLQPLAEATPNRDPQEAVALRDELDRAFARLTSDQRAIVVLRHYAGWRVVDIAALLGVPEGTATSRLHYAMASLRAALDAEDRGQTLAQRTRT